MGRIATILERAALVVCISCAAAIAQTEPVPEVDWPYGIEGYTFPPALLKPSTSPRTVELLVKALAANPAPSRRAELVRDLGECRLPSAIPAIVNAMSDPDPAVRAEAARTSAVIGDHSALQPLAKLLKDTDSAVRVQAVRAGAKMNDASFVTAGLEDSDPGCLMAGCGFASTSKHFDLIVSRFSTMSESEKCVALRALARSGTSEHAVFIGGMLSGGSVPVIISAIETLAESKAISQADAAKAMLSHAHPTVRRAAIRSMSVLAISADQATIAMSALADPDLSVRQAACELLSRSPSPDAVPVLVRQLSLGYGPLRVAARQALISSDSVASARVRNEAAALLGDVDRDRRIDGSYILGSLRSDIAFERHSQLLEEADWGVAQQAIESLGEIGRPDVAERIARIAMRAKQDEKAGASAPGEPEAIGSALVACAKLGYKPIFSLARELVPQKLTSPIAIRSKAIWAAGVLGDADDADLAAALLAVANDNSPYENELARFEAIKAIGNQKHLAALGDMQQLSREQSVPKLRWMAYAVAKRMNSEKESEPFTPPTINHIAETSIQDLAQ